MKNNTKKEILNALNHLMQRYSFEKITVPMIIAQAGISKATFYRHFKDKQEVLCSNFDLILSKSLEKSHSLPDMLYHLALEYSRLGKRVGHEILQYAGDNNYTEYVKQRSLEFLRELSREYRSGNEMNEAELFQCEILLSGIAHSIRLLTLNSTPQQKRRQAEILAKMLPKEIAGITW